MKRKNWEIEKKSVRMKMLRNLFRDLIEKVAMDREDSIGDSRGEAK